MSRAKAKPSTDKAMQALVNANYHDDDPFGKEVVTTSISMPRELKTWAEDLARENKRAGKGEASVSKLVCELLKQHRKNLERRSSRKG